MSTQEGTTVGPSARQIILVGGVFLLAIAAAGIIPRIDFALAPGYATPGPISFVGVGLCVLVLTGALFIAGLRRIVPRGVVFLGAVLGYNALIIIVKFTLGPVQLYVVSEHAGLQVLTNQLAFPGVAAITALLYAVAFLILYALYRGEVQRKLGIPVQFERGVIQLFIAMFVIATVGIVTVIGLVGFFEYTLSVFLASVIGLGVAIALLAAIALASLAFSEAASQAVMTRNVAALSTFAWIGLAFIAAYHIVWFVFVLTLISLWPLKAYTGK